MPVWINKISVSVKPEVFPVVTLCLLLVPISWVIAWVAAVLLHEALHILAISLCGERIYGIQIGTGGASIVTSGLSYKKEAICAVSGPLAGVLLLPLIHICPRIVFCGVFQSVYNLLPILPLDGGRVLYCVMADRLGGQKAEKLMNVVQLAALLGLFVLSAYLAVGCSLGYVPLLLFAMLSLRCRKNTLQRKR